MELKKKQGNNMRALDVAARMIDKRPDHESIELFCRRAGLRYTVTIGKLYERNDIYVGFLYQICKLFGYQIIVFNPNPPEGLEKSYIIDDNSQPITPRERRKKTVYRKDKYNCKVFRQIRHYEKHDKFKEIKDNGEER